MVWPALVHFKAKFTYRQRVAFQPEVNVLGYHWSQRSELQS